MTTTTAPLDEYLTIVPRGLQDVVQELLPRQIRQNSSSEVVVVQDLTCIGEDTVQYSAAHLQGLQSRLAAATVKKQKKRQRLTANENANNTANPTLTRLPFGNVYDARTARHVGLGFDEGNNAVLWSLPGSNTGTVWLRFSTNATPAAIAACRCIGPLLALVHTYQVTSTDTEPRTSKEDVLQDLKQAMTSTTDAELCIDGKWNKAMSLWQRHMRLQDRTGWNDAVTSIKYRCSCVRDDSKKYPYARHEILQDAAAYLVPPDVAKNSPVNLDKFDAEFVWFYRPYASVVAINVRNYAAVGAISFRQGQALPPDITPPYLQGDVLKETIRLRPTTAHLLLHLAKLQDGDVVIDPCVGMGTIVMECLHLQGASCLTAMGGDLELKESLRQKAAEYEKQTCQWLTRQGRALHSHACLCAWDASTLPLETGTVDAIVSDLPFGRSCLSSDLLSKLMPLLLESWARVLKPSTGRMTLLCGNPQVLLDAMHLANQKVLQQDDVYSSLLLWELPVSTVRPVNIGGHVAWILVVSRGPRPRSEVDETLASKLRIYHHNRDRRRTAAQR